MQRPARRDATIGAVLLGLALWSVFTPADAFGRVESAWVCLLAGGVAIMLGTGEQEKPGRLVTTGLFAVGIAAVAAMFLVTVTPFSWGELSWLASRHYGMQSRMLLEIMTAQLQNAPGGTEVLQGVEATLTGMVELVTRLLPALILLQSVAALAAAWALYRWLVPHPEGDPLPTLREFRFSDQLIWGIVLALVALVFPGVQALHQVGGNLAAFFGGLYVVRGLGVVAALAAAAGVGGPFVALLSAFITIILMPLVMFGALALGVTDTWVDWRKLATLKKNG